MILPTCQLPDGNVGGLTGLSGLLSCALAPKSLGLRASSEQDKVFLKRLYADVRKDEVNAWNWPDEMAEQFLEMQFHAQSSAYLLGFPDAEDLLVLDGHIPIGRVLTIESADLLRLIDLAILENYRGNGLGTLILESLKLRASEQAKAVLLSVHRVNPAARLYARCGFKITGGDEVYLQMSWNPGDL